MRLRLGILRDQAEINKQVAREQAEAQEKRHKHEIPTVKTEVEHLKAEEKAKAKEKEKEREKDKEKKQPPPKLPKIKPLSEAKAIESGANLFADTFLFMVALGALLFQEYTSRKKAKTRREDVADRIEELEQSEKSARKGLNELEKEILRLRSKYENKQGHPARILPREVWVEEGEELQEDNMGKSQGWFSWVRIPWKSKQVSDAVEKDQAATLSASTTSTISSDPHAHQENDSSSTTPAFPLSSPNDQGIPKDQSRSKSLSNTGTKKPTHPFSRPEL